MKYLLILSGLSLLFTAAAMAGGEGPCASFGKYGAMRAYKATATGVHADINYEVSHMRTKNEKSLYHVAVSESKREVVSYFVTVEASEASCRILDVTQTSVSDF
jgi:hypothetical protein